MRLLGLDPGLRHTGWGIIESHKDKISWIASGNISPQPNIAIDKRLFKISSELSRIVEEFKPEEAAIEQIFVGINGQSALKLGMARGGALNTCACFQLSIYEYEATLVKKAVTGFGRASKEQVFSMIKMLLPGVKCKTEDESDAFAVTICHSHFSNSKLNKLNLDKK